MDRARRRAGRARDRLCAGLVLARRAAARGRSLHRGRRRKATRPACRWRRASATMENAAPADIDEGLIKTADEDRSPSQPARYRRPAQTFTEVDRHEQGEAVRPRHAAARQSRQDRRDRDPLDDDGLLAVQRRRVSEVFVRRRSGTRFRPTSATRATRWSRAANAYLDAFLEGKKDLVPWGYPVQPHRRRRAHGQRVADGQLRRRRPERRQHRQPPLHRRRDDRLGAWCSARSARAARTAAAARPTRICSASRTASCATCTR